MPKVTFSPFVAGHTPSGEDVFDYLYSIPPEGTPDSCSILNGWLDSKNLESFSPRTVSPYSEKSNFRC
jgi:hypothetical protein